MVEKETKFLEISDLLEDFTEKLPHLEISHTKIFSLPSQTIASRVRQVQNPNHEYV